MPVLLTASINDEFGVAEVRFPFDRATLDTVKQIPGFRWDPEARVWRTSVHGVAALEHRGLEVVKRVERVLVPKIPERILNRLRPYQVEAAQFLLREAGALLTMDPRTGKTPTAIAAALGKMEAGAIDSVVVTYPASVAEEWRQQLYDWAGLDIFTLNGLVALDSHTVEKLRATPRLVAGCSYEILSQRIRDIHAILRGRRFAVIADEIHACKNRKADRTRALLSLARAFGWAPLDDRRVESGIAVARWGLTGTPMRNRPRDMFCLFDFTHPGSMGSYWTYAKAYCNAYPGEYGWVDDGASREDELAARLARISYRKTRAEVAAYLPKSDRKVILCELPESGAHKYRALESEYAARIRVGLDEPEPTPADREALRRLAMATAAGKVLTVVQRAYEHCARGVKVLVFANFHETLTHAEAVFDAKKDRDPTLPPHFCAGGWMTPEKRRKAIERWKQTPGPAILLANILSSGVGIDLADAEVAIFLELAWVPADFIQAEARIQDVHLGKRKTPPIYEYLIVKDTVDEAMAAAILAKIRNIEAVVGRDAETDAVADTLRSSGVVGPTRLGLPSTDDETIRQMILGIRARLLSAPVSSTSRAAAADAKLAFEGGIDDVDAAFEDDLGANMDSFGDAP